MQDGSLVECIREMDGAGKYMCRCIGMSPLQLGGQYVVTKVGIAGRFKEGVKPSVELEEYGGTIYFWQGLFKEVQPPMEVSLEALVKEPETVI